MSTTRFYLTGVTELREQLRNLPAKLAAEAGWIVREAGGSAGAAIIDAYPVGPTGNLRKGVTVKTHRGPAGTAVIVRSIAPHAWLFENGSQARHTDLGVNRGAMPPGHVVIPIAIRVRRKMVADLIALVERQGLTVTGNG